MRSLPVAPLHIALWSALRSAIRSNSYGIDTSPPAVQPIAAVGLAAVSDMNGCSDGTASGSAIRNLHGGVSSCAEVVPYNNYVSPRQMLTLLNPMTVDVAFYLSHGSSDTTVSPVQSTRFKADANNLLFTTAEPSTFDTFSLEKITLMSLIQIHCHGKMVSFHFWITF